MLHATPAYRLDAMWRNVAQPGSALDWGSRGRGFESRHSDHSSQSDKAPPEPRDVAMYRHSLSTRPLKDTALSPALHSLAAKYVTTICILSERQCSRCVDPQETKENVMLKGVVLWAMGVPIIVIVLLYAFIF
jgi:hypothetical protein